MTLATPALGSNDFLPDEWDEAKNAGIAPRFCSTVDSTAELREEFLGGARALGLVGRRKQLQPQQLLLADVLNAGARFTSVLMPRRSTKTTTILAWLIGRCLEREDYLCAYGMMTSQKKARDRFLKDVVPILERVYPDARTRPFKIVRANGQERLTFDNGSILLFLGPSGDDYRSDAYDVIVLDEAGEATPEDAEDVLTAALPTQDTRPGAMLIMAGTGAKFRKGQMLWDELEKGRAGEDRHAVLDYSTPTELTAEELEDWDLIAELLLECHPGIGGLTTLESVHDNWESFTPDRFAREYLGIFGMEGVATGLIKMETWAKLAQSKIPAKPPARVAVAAAAHPDQLSATIAAAWRDSKGKAHGIIVERKKGVKWLAPRALEISKSAKLPIVHDTAGVITVEVEALARQKVKLAPQTFKNIQTAAALIVKEIDTGNFQHYDQPDLNEAARVVTKRKMGLSGAWGLGRSVPDDDITPLEAIAMALRYYDDNPYRKSYVPPEARAA